MRTLSPHKKTVWIFSWLIAFSATFIFAAEKPSTFPTNNNPEPTAQITKIEKHLSALTEKVAELEGKLVQTQKENQRLHELSESDNWTDYVSLWVPIFLVLMGLIFTARHMRKTEEHNQRQIEETQNFNRLNVRPDLVSTKRISRYDEKLGLFIENNGIGPGIIIKMKLYLDNVPQPTNGLREMNAFIQGLDLGRFNPQMESPSLCVNLIPYTPCLG